MAGNNMKTQKITDAQIREAHAVGLQHKDQDNIYWSYYSGVLQAAYDAGRMGYGLGSDVVECERFGALPVSGRSYNYADNHAEAGVSVIMCGTDADGAAGAQLFMSHRKIFRFRGIRIVGTNGSDGEILVFPVDYYDFLD